MIFWILLNGIGAGLNLHCYIFGSHWWANLVVGILNIFVALTLLKLEKDNY